MIAQAGADVPKELYLDGSIAKRRLSQPISSANFDNKAEGPTFLFWKRNPLLPAESDYFPEIDGFHPTWP
jgi:hypothetical protein